MFYFLFCHAFVMMVRHKWVDGDEVHCELSSYHSNDNHLDDYHDIYLYHDHDHQLDHDIDLTHHDDHDDLPGATDVPAEAPVQAPWPRSLLPYPPSPS